MLSYSTSPNYKLDTADWSILSITNNIGELNANLHKHKQLANITTISYYANSWIYPQKMHKKVPSCQVYQPSKY